MNTRKLPGTETYSGEAKAPPSRPELPQTASPANNPALNRSAEALGRGMGVAVAEARRLPQRIDKLRSRIHLVPQRQAVREPLLDLTDSAIETAAQWRDAAEDTLEELRDRAGSYTHEMADRTNRSWGELQHHLDLRTVQLRRSARRWLMTTRQWQRERPLQVIGVCAAAAFAAGVALRIWRSNLE
ncbi:MAG TPA: hypothetical protein VFB04_12105 [Terriglobales bacterium]|nr:hypothetical protein [Terriglobales bacterium]